MPMTLLQIGKKLPPTKLKDRIYLSISSEGYGHSSRALALASQFSKEEILIGTYDYALDRIRAFEYPCVGIPQEVKFVGSEGGFDVGKTILQNSGWALTFNQIIQEEMDILKRNGISLVVADGRMAPVIAASRLDIPCLVLTNQSAFYPFFEQDSPLVKFFGRSFEWVMKLWLSSAEEILIPDFPPPYTVCLPNLSDNYQVKKRTRFVGPLVAWQRDEVIAVPRDQNRPFIVVSLGGHSYRRPLFDAMIAVARFMPEMQFELMTPFSLSSPPPNVTLHPQVKDCAPYFKAADLVITQAGHSTAMELLTLGKPSIIVPDAKQIEQENNATRMAELGVSRKIEYSELEPALLIETIHQMLASPRYRDNAAQLADKAAELHGAAHAAGVLREYAHRLLAY